MLFGEKTQSTSLFGGNSDSSSGSSLLPTFQDQPACADCCPNLSYQQRIIGYASCTAMGFVLSAIGTFVLFGGMSDKNVSLFAVLYVLGNIIALCATGFLLGPRQQCIKMWQPTRRWSTAFYLFMIIIVFVVALLKQNVWLILFLLVVEIVAGLWYSLSFVPFGRKIACNFLRACGVCFPCFYIYDNTKESCNSCNKKPEQENSLTNFFGGGSKK